MVETPKNHTHTAYAFQRTGRKHGRLLEVGSGRIDRDRDIVYVTMNRQPLGGYTGFVILSPHGVTPPPPLHAKPQHPEESDEAGDQFDE